MVILICIGAQPCDRIAHKVDDCGLESFKQAMETLAQTELATPDAKIRFWCGPEKEAP